MNERLERILKMAEDNEDQLFNTLDMVLIDGSRYDFAFEVMMALMINKIKQADKQIEEIKINKRGLDE